MKKIRPDHSPKWYILYSIFSLFIIIGVFSIMNSYAQVINTQLQYENQVNSITFKTVDDIANPALVIPEPPAAAHISLLGPGILAFFGIAGFLFTKFLYERQVKQNVRS